LQANGSCPANHFVDATACTYDYASNIEIYPERRPGGTRDPARGGGREDRRQTGRILEAH
jgi:hypothetical protein